MEEPVVAIVIPVGPAHARHVGAALGSLLWQSFKRWEAIVVNDSGEMLDLPDDPRITTVIRSVERYGPARGRNIGTKAATAPFVLYLDADDYLLPRALEKLIRGHARHNEAYSFSDHYAVLRDGRWLHMRPPDYKQSLYEQYNLHPITALLPRAAVLAVGGFDEDVDGLEDWTLYLRLAKAGYCGAHVHGPVFVYRYEEGVQHHLDLERGEQLMDAIRKRYRGPDGKVEFMGCGCGGGAATAKGIAQNVALTLGAEDMGDRILLEYTGDSLGAQSFRGPSGVMYRAGATASRRMVDVTAAPQDADYLLSLGIFQRVPPPEPFAPAPEDVDVTFTPAASFVETVAEGTEEESVAPEESAEDRKKRERREREAAKRETAKAERERVASTRSEA